MAQKSVNNKYTYGTEVYGNVIKEMRVEVPAQPKKVQGPVEVSRKNYKRQQNALSIRYCVFLAVACIFTLVVGAFYLQQQALATKNQKTIASLESQLAELKKENADNLNRIETSINLEEIRDIAINELGMIYATEENVVLYKNTRQNYVSQYEEIPEKETSLVDSIIKSK